MGNYVIKEKTVKMDDSWDVIVVGGGPAGCTAATAAAREGSKTLLIEANGCLGGMGTSGLVNAWCPFSDKEKIIYRGLAERVFNETKKRMPHIPEEALNWVAIDPEALKRIYDDLVLESGASILFNTFLSCVETDELGNVDSIIVSNKAGLSAYKAKVYIDCTGDADLSAWAGAEFHKGDDITGDLQPATLCFILSNVDNYAYFYGPRLYPGNKNSPAYDLAESDKYPLILDAHMIDKMIGPSTIGFNAGHIWDVDNTNPESISRALIQGRKLAEQIRNGLAELHPAFANAYLVATGASMGVRETRRIIGDYCLTVEDFLARRSFEDEICRNSYYIDIHHTKDEVEIMNKNFDELVSRIKRYEKGESHGIPYRCLLPKSLKNVLVAGRSISCDRPVQGSIRVMPVCMATGEAAGIAASMAVKTAEHDVHAVDVQVLRKRLREEGAYLP